MCGKNNVNAVINSIQPVITKAKEDDDGELLKLQLINQVKKDAKKIK